MSRLEIIVGLIRFLYRERFSVPLKYTVNRDSHGRKWFLVEPAVVMVPFLDCGKAEIVVDGCRYARVGGGAQAGSYVLIGAATGDDAEPMPC